MKHEKIIPNHTDTPLPGLNDEEIEARVFRNLKAKQRVFAEEQDSAVVIFQFPDKRSVFQRLAARWYLRTHHSQPVASGKVDEAVTEPVWNGHWATAKYL